MKQLLTPNTITYSDAGVNSTIDPVFATPLLADSLITCCTQQDIHSSDHFPIENVCLISKRFRSRRRMHANSKKTDTMKLQKVMKQELQIMPFYDHNNATDIDVHVDRLLDAVTRSIEASAPMTRICKYSKLGFDEGCKEAVTTARRLHKAYQEEETEEAWEEYKLARIGRRLWFGNRKGSNIESLGRKSVKALPPCEGHARHREEEDLHRKHAYQLFVGPMENWNMTFKRN